MLRLITFLEEAAGVELVLPVAPSSYQWTHEVTIEMVTVDRLGDLNFFGGKRIRSTTLHDCLLPAQVYPFLSPKAGTNPWFYPEQLERWVDRGAVVQWLMSDTPVNVAVLPEGVTYRKQDDTNDPYAGIILRQYARPEIPVPPAEPSVSSVGTVASWDSATGTVTAKTCIMIGGDTLWGICRRYYRDGSLVWRLAAANDIVNANLIHPGRVLTIPPLAQLPVAAARPPSAKIAVVVKVREVKEEENGTVHLMPRMPENTVKSPMGLELDKIAPGGGLWQSTRWWSSALRGRPGTWRNG